MSNRPRLSAAPLPAPSKTLASLGRYHEYESFLLGADKKAE